MKNKAPAKGKTILAFTLGLLAICFTITGCGDSVNLAYDNSPDTVVIEYWVGGGLAPRWVDNAPQFRLFGDGKVLRMSADSDTGLLMEARLNQKGVRELLEKVESTGYFGLKEGYYNRNIMDAGSSIMTVTLKNLNKSVSVYATRVGGFSGAVSAVMDFPLGQEKEYVPEKGYLFVDTLAETEGSKVENSFNKLKGALPAPAELENALKSNRLIEIDGKRFIEIKRYESEKGKKGVYVMAGDKTFKIFPIYQPSSL